MRSSNLLLFVLSSLGSFFQGEAGEENADFPTTDFPPDATDQTVGAAGRSVWTGRERSSQCRGTVTTLRKDEATVLKSHHGHGRDPYPENYQCRWLFIPDDCDIDLECSVGTNNSTDDCVRSDYLRILAYRGTKDSFYCGSRELNLTFAGDDAVAITFRAANRTWEGGVEELPSDNKISELAGFSCKVVCRKSRLTAIASTTTTSIRNEIPPPKPPSNESVTLLPPKLNCKCGESRSARIVCPAGLNCTANLGAVPWQAAIISAHRSQPWCGGTIISDQYVLTAAHCLQSKAAGKVQVVLGDSDWTTKEEARELRYDVAEIKMHPSFGQAAQFDFDFALVRLARPVKYSSTVRPACLPDELQEGVDHEDDDTLLVGKDADVSGWGVTDPKSPQRQARKLQHVSVKIMSRANCSAMYDSGAVTASMFCASAMGGDACFGDSGGPLTVKTQGSSGPSVLEGVISWGKSCAKEDWPGVYARVRGVLGWIKNNTQDSSFCSKRVPEYRSNSNSQFHEEMISTDFVFPE